MKIYFTAVLNKLFWDIFFYIVGPTLKSLILSKYYRHREYFLQPKLIDVGQSTLIVDIVYSLHPQISVLLAFVLSQIF
jgi:hypothetical protein